MLSYLRVRGLALLDDVALHFAPGMNVLTGETGAGKSIIVGALSLLRGVRARADIVRAGEDTAIVDAQFEPRDGVQRALAPLLCDYGVPDAEIEALVMQRTVSRAGRGRCFVQATLTTQAALARVGEELLDICSQHEHHFLTHPARHQQVLDAYAGLESEAAQYGERYATWRDAAARMADLRERARDAAARADYLRFQLEEVERVAPQPGEHEALQRRLGLLRAAHRWAAFAREAQAVLYEDDDAIASRLASLAQRADGGAEDSGHLADISEQLAAAQVACEEAAQVAARFAGELEIEPGELEIADDRLHELEALRRKHGVEVDELATRSEQMRRELEELEHADDHLAALAARVEELEGACARAAAQLSAKRAQAAEGLARGVEAELAALHIEDARLEVNVERAAELGPTGGDRVEVLFSANRGEPVAALKRVASGGELSRVLLAIKTVLAGGDRVATYVFDEVDAGVGGGVGEAIGRRLQTAAADHQVLCVTHLPQIAAFADAHFRVEKQTSGGRTTTTVRKLDRQARIQELARMLGGSATTARDHATKLLTAAHGRTKPAPKRARGSSGRRARRR